MYPLLYNNITSYYFSPNAIDIFLFLLIIIAMIADPILETTKLIIAK